MKIKLTALVLVTVLLLCSCSNMPYPSNSIEPYLTEQTPPQGRDPVPNRQPMGDSPDLGGDNESFGADLSDTGAYDGFFDGESTDFEISCISGTAGAYKLEDSTLIFSGLREDSVYSIKGKLSGNIVIDAGDTYKLTLELHGFSLVSGDTNPITIKSGNKVTITAKKDCKSYIYDTRAKKIGRAHV